MNIIQSIDWTNRVRGGMIAVWTQPTTSNSLRHIFSELSKGNAKPFVESLADDVRWTITGTTKWSKTFQGKRAVLTDLLEPLRSQFAIPYTATAHRFIAEGDHVVVEGRGCVTTKAGIPYNNAYC